jgi:predicted ATPase
MFESSLTPIRRIEEHPLHPMPRDEWPANIPAVRSLLSKGLDLSPITVIVGENGSGKSTVMEAIAGAFGLNVEGGTRNALHHTQRTESQLSDNLRLVRSPGASKKGVFLRAETMHSHLAYLSDLNSGRHNFQSHGESFIEFLRDRSSIQGLWMFDEAESALSFNGCLTLVAHIMELVEHGSQIIMSTHSPILAALPDADILEFSTTGIQHQRYDDLEMVKNWRSFLDFPERFLHYLR